MDDGTATEECPIADVDMSGQQHGIGDDDAAADLAIMSHMTACHQKAVSSDMRKCIGPGGTTDRHVLPNDAPGTDSYTRRDPPIKAQILRITANYRKRVNNYPLAELAVTPDQGVWMDDAAIGEPYPLLNESSGMN